jgi:hypothetical protein
LPSEGPGLWSLFHGRPFWLFMILDRYHILYLLACSFVARPVDCGPRRIPCVFMCVPLVSLPLYAMNISATFREKHKLIYYVSCLIYLCEIKWDYDNIEWVSECLRMVLLWEESLQFRNGRKLKWNPMLMLCWETCYIAVAQTRIIVNTSCYRYCCVTSSRITETHVTWFLDTVVWHHLRMHCIATVRARTRRKHFHSIVTWRTR